MLETCVESICRKVLAKNNFVKINGGNTYKREGIGLRICSFASYSALYLVEPSHALQSRTGGD